MWRLGGRWAYERTPRELDCYRLVAACDRGGAVGGGVVTESREAVYRRRQRELNKMTTSVWKRQLVGVRVKFDNSVHTRKQMLVETATRLGEAAKSIPDSTADPTTVKYIFTEYARITGLTPVQTMWDSGTPVWPDITVVQATALTRPFIDGKTVALAPGQMSVELIRSDESGEA